MSFSSPSIRSGSKHTHHRRFRRWCRKRAKEEYQHWLNHHPLPSADGYKEAPYWTSHPDRASILRWCEHVLLRHRKEEVIEKQETLKKRWHLPSDVQVHVI